MANCKQCNVTDGVVPGLGVCLKCAQDMMNMVPTQERKPAKGSTVDDQAWYLKGSTSSNEVRTVQVDGQLRDKLKPYQVEGVEFIWRNSFSDFNHHEKGDQSMIGGCILAHYMGLGKSLTTVVLLHTALTCPSMVGGATKKPLLHTVLLIAPANTLTNWVHEVEKWTKKLSEPLNVLNMGEITSSTKGKNIKKWKREGGLLIMSDRTFLKLAKEIVEGAQPDVLVLDEAHTMLKTSVNKGFKRLQEIRTKRRILLTGTPLQNNVTEYYRMVEYIRPGIAGVASEAEFETMYRLPIEAGLPSDATDLSKLESMQLQLRLKKKLEPHVNRKSASVLRQLLPPIYDTLLYLLPSRIQARLLKLEEKSREDGIKSRNFWSKYHSLHPLLNHPGCLKLVKKKRGQELTWKSADEAGDEWYMQAGLEDREFKTMHESRNSTKLIILAHILAYSLLNGDKILIYSDNLSTLDILEWFLSQPDWKRQVTSLGKCNLFKNIRLGGWKKGQDYVRIDGSIDSGRRGCLVDDFNDEEGIKAFLISSQAGGIGINLCSASVVVMMDNHFNPSISDQCISRAHRLGQTKPVYCFRLAIEETLEATIYARSVNKSGVAMQVVDGKSSERIFSAEELSNLDKCSIIETCASCKKRRRLLPSQDPPNEDKEWHCGMNEDRKYNDCSIPEDPKLKKPVLEQKYVRKYVDNNPILQHVRGVVNAATRRSEIVNHFLPVEIVHETDICCEDAIEKLEATVYGRKPSATKRRVLSIQKDENPLAESGKEGEPIELDLSDSESEGSAKRQRA